MTSITHILSGALFAAGLVLAEMTNPEKIRSFLDVFGRWDPSLSVTLLGAILVHAPAYRYLLGRPSSFFGDAFQLPTRRDIDLPLVVGAALFGVGWGLSGYCPGPALAGVLSGRPSSYLFVVAMAAGMFVHAGATRLLGRLRPPAAL